MGRILTFIYGIASYLVFLATFVYAVGFIGNFLTPTALDAAPTKPLGVALLINLGLLTLFAVQHSVMARPAFKRIWTKLIPEPAERSTYVLFSSLALILMFWAWEPMGGMIWHVESTLGQALLYTGYAFGWGLVFVSTWLISHFDLFGLRQVWLNLRGVPYTQLPFRTPSLYRLVRHPLYVGWLFAFWCTPTMTVAHLIFAVMTTAYILVAIQLEERDLVKHLKGYAAYRKQVPMLIPRFGRRTVASQTEALAGAES